MMNVAVRNLDGYTSIKLARICEAMKPLAPVKNTLLSL